MSRPSRPSRPLHRWRRALIEDNQLPSRAKLVGCVLGEHMTTDELKCWPGLVTIAREASLSKRTAVRALDDLEAAGYLLRHPGREGYATRYEGVEPTATSALSNPPTSELSALPTSELSNPLGGSALVAPTRSLVTPTSALVSKTSALVAPELVRTLPRTPPGTLTPVPPNANVGVTRHEGGDHQLTNQQAVQETLAHIAAEREQHFERAAGEARELAPETQTVAQIQQFIEELAAKRATIPDELQAKFEGLLHRLHFPLIREQLYTLDIQEHADALPGLFEAFYELHARPEGRERLAA